MQSCVFLVVCFVVCFGIFLLDFCLLFVRSGVRVYDVSVCLTIQVTKHVGVQQHDMPREPIILASVPLVVLLVLLVVAMEYCVRTTDILPMHVHY